MKCFLVKTGALALLSLCMVPAGWAAPGSKNAQKDQQGPSLEQPKPGQGKNGASGPTVTKDEEKAYKTLYEARDGDPAKLISLGEAFVGKYPDSPYAGAVYSYLTTAYKNTNQHDKMLDAGDKALALNPDNIDVLPVLAWAIPRLVTAQTPNGPQELQKAQTYAKRGIQLLTTMQKPQGLTDADFAKAKNDKLSMCHDGLGVIDVKTGKYDDAITELTQSLQLSSEPDPVDYYLRGISNETTSHYTDAEADFTKCAAAGPLQGQCKAQLDATKKRAKNSLEAPN